MYHFTRYISPLRNAKIKEIEDFPYPNVDGYTDEHMKEVIDKAHKNKNVTACSIVHMYEIHGKYEAIRNFLWT